MLCPTCHSKITKGDVTESEVSKVKFRLSQRGSIVVLEDVILKSRYCSWKISGKDDYSFIRTSGSQTGKPIFEFRFINHSNKTVILKSIESFLNVVPSSLNGVGEPDSMYGSPGPVRSIITYDLKVEYDERVVHRPETTIEVQSKRAFSFQTMFYTGRGKDKLNITGRTTLDVVFRFSDGHEVVAPTLFLNCDNTQGPKLLILA